MRVLALTRYNSDGSSSRVRFYQYFPYLLSRGVELQVAPLLPDNYVRDLYDGKHPSIPSIFNSYLHRILQLTRSGSVDILWVEKELFPWLSPAGESFLKIFGIPYVVDYDDAVFHRYDLHKDWLIRRLLGKSVDGVMRRAQTVVTGNQYLADRARQAGARQIEYLPSVVDASKYRPTPRGDGPFTIGWIGSPVTAHFLAMIRNALAEVIQKTGARLLLVGTGKQDPLAGIEKTILPWSKAGEIEAVQSFDVGIMPLPDEAFERGKCGYKLIQYMACGLPVVASPVGVNSRIVEAGKNGFLASTTQEWVDALVALANDAALRNDFGAAGRQKVEQEFSLQVAAPRLLEILSRASGRP